MKLSLLNPTSSRLSLLFTTISLFFFCSSYSQNEDQSVMKLDETRNNSVYMTVDFVLSFSINYERLFSLGEKVNLGLRGGLGVDGGNKNLVVIGEGIFLFGRSKHFLETGVGYQQPIYYFEEGPDSPLVGIMAGYRYQSLKGFLVKIYPEYLIEVSPKEDSWGNFPFLGFAMGYSF